VYLKSDISDNGIVDMESILLAAIVAAVLVSASYDDSLLTCALQGMFQFGFNTGVINSPQGAIEAFIQKSYADRGNAGVDANFLFSLAVNVCNAGGMVGGLLAGGLADWLGRKRSLLYVQAFSISGAVLMGLCEVANSYEMLFLGRLLIGLACGFFTGLVPMYVTEIAPVNIRGGLGTVNQLAVTVGILSSQFLGLDIILGNEDNWPLLLALGGLVPAVAQCFSLPFMPESPKYFIINKGDDESGEKSLKRLRSKVNREDVLAELDEMRQSREEARATSSESVSIWQLLTDSQYRLPLAITVMMHLSQQLSGIVAIFYYSTDFFINAGVDKDNAQYATLGVGAIMVTMTLVTIPLMDRLGRRTLHLTGLVGIVVFSSLITVMQNLEPEENNTAGVFLILFTLSFVVFFALGPGSIPWLITGELFNQAPRSAATAVATVVNWSANLIVGLVFPKLADNETMDTFSFLPFTVITAILAAALYFLLPETKGRTTEEVTQLLARRSGGDKRGEDNRAMDAKPSGSYDA